MTSGAPEWWDVRWNLKHNPRTRHMDWDADPREWDGVMIDEYQRMTLELEHQADE